jgi:hypothetical protein
MRTLRHPIAVFVVIVLMIIAIGVGVVAATTSQNVYGPSWGRFSASFPGRVYEEPFRLPVPQPAMHYYSLGGWHSARSRFPGFSIAEAVSAEHVKVPVSAQDLRELFLELKGGFAVPPTEHTQQVNGFRFTRLGPQCQEHLCQEVLIVVHNRTSWVLSAWSLVGLGPVESFLDSFQPIG